MDNAEINITWNVLFISDSRGRNIFTGKSEDLSQSNITVTAISMPGYNLQQLTDLSIENSPDLYDQVIISGGICDVTTKDYTSKEITLKYMTVNECERNVKMHLINSQFKLKDLTTHLSYTDLYGARLSEINSKLEHDKLRSKGDYVNMQTILNDSIFRLNKMIKEFNRDINSMSTAYISNAVSKNMGKNFRKGSPIKHCYKRLTDGLHPDEATKHKLYYILKSHIMKTKKH